MRIAVIFSCSQPHPPVRSDLLPHTAGDIVVISTWIDLYNLTIGMLLLKLAL